MTRTKKVSPTTQLGPFPPEVAVSTKNAPTHCDDDSCTSWKSAGLTDQLGPPKEMATLTAVSHAVATCLLSTLCIWATEIPTIGVVPIPTTRSRCRSRYLRKDVLYSARRSAHQRCPSIDRSVRRRSRRKSDAFALYRHSCQNKNKTKK